MTKDPYAIRRRCRWRVLLGCVMAIFNAAVATFNFERHAYGAATFSGLAFIVVMWATNRTLSSWVMLNKSLSSLEKIHKQDT